MSAIPGILAKIYLPAFFARRGEDQTEGGVSGQHDHLIIVGTLDLYSRLIDPLPETISTEISPTMGGLVAIRFRPDYRTGGTTAHLVPVEWSERTNSHIVDDDKALLYRDGGNIAVVPEPFVTAINDATGHDSVATIMPIHDCTA